MKIKSILLAGLILLMAGADANALVFGIRFSDLTQNTMPVIRPDLTGEAGSKGRFGIYLGSREKNSVFLVGADYDRFKMERADSLLYSRRLTLNIGYRYQLLPSGQAAAMSFNPFIAFHYFKSFSQVVADSGFISASEVKYLKDLANDNGLWISGGAEYAFAPAFGFGAEAGVRYSKASSNALGYKVRKSEYNTFVSLIMSFYL